MRNILLTETDENPLSLAEMLPHGQFTMQSMASLGKFHTPGWRTNQAYHNAKKVVDGCDEPTLIVCVGTRVAKAVYRAVGEKTYPTLPGLVVQASDMIWYTRLPRHEINDPHFLREIRERFRENYESLQ